MNGLVSNQFKTDVLNDHRSFKYLVKATLTDSTILYFGEGTGVTIEKPLMSIGWNEAVSDDSSITLGNCIINKLTFSLPNFANDFNYDLVGAKIEVSVSLDLTTNTTETLARGTYYVKDTPVFDQSVVTVTAYDTMTAFDVLFSGVGIDFTQNPSLASIATAIGTYCSVTVDTTNIVAMNVSECEFDETTTCRQILSDIAEISGCNCRISPANQLIFTWYTNTSGVWQNQETLGGVFDLKLEREDTVITGVRVVFGKEVDANGDVLQSDWIGNSQDYMISIEDNAFVNASTYTSVLANLSHLVNLTYRKGHVSHIGLPWLCAGDTAVVTDRSGTARNIIVSSTDYTANERQNTTSAGYDSAINIPDAYTDRTRKIVDLAAILNVIGLNAEWIHTGALVVKDGNDNVVFKADITTGTVEWDTQYSTMNTNGHIVLRSNGQYVAGLDVEESGVGEAYLYADRLLINSPNPDSATYAATEIILTDQNGNVVFKIDNGIGTNSSRMTIQGLSLENWIQNKMLSQVTFAPSTGVTVASSDLACNGNICTAGITLSSTSAMSSATVVGKLSKAPSNLVIGLARTSSINIRCSINTNGNITLTPDSNVPANTTIYISLTFAVPVLA